jgi:hypothetical protein
VCDRAALNALPLAAGAKMSDYGDDLSDYGDEWFYVEEEYMVADDLAEHAVQSPPPMTYEDEEEWDRFEYFVDIEYASDGYDDAKFEPKNGTGDTKIGKKRKRGTTTTPSRKRQKPVKPQTIGQGDMEMLSNSPVVWRSHEERDARPKVLEGNTEAYALMKDWREKLADTPQWTRQSSHSTPPDQTASQAANAKLSFVSDPKAPICGAYDEEEEEEDGEEDAQLDPAAIMAVLQERLAAEGGPLSGMNPEQVLQFAMRMAGGGNVGDDVAGEMADEMLDKMMNQGDGDEEDEDAEANLLSWVAQQRDTSSSGTVNGQSSATTSTPHPAGESRGTKRPLTPPSSEANHSVRHKDDVMEHIIPHVTDATDAAASAEVPQEADRESRKRKAVDSADVEDTETATKKRATRSYAASTAASQAKTAPPKTTRSGRARR